MSPIFVYTISDIVGVAVFGIAVLFFTFFCFHIAMRRLFCKHETTFVNQISLDEICRNCQKKLGFVGRNK